MPGILVPYPEFVGGTYTSRASRAGDNEISFNLYSETIESRAGKNTGLMYRTPGLDLWCLLPTGPTQAEYELNGRAWVVSGNIVYETFEDKTFIARGAISPPPPGQYVSITANSASELMIVTPPNGFILNTVSNVLTQITDAGFLGGVTGTMIDGFFVANAPNTAKFSVSNFQAGLVWNGINQQATQDYPDNLVAVDNFTHYLALFGGNRSEVYYNTGSNSTIFARYEGSYMYVGLAAAWSRVHIDNTIFFLGRNENGTCILYRLEGFSPKRVSDYSFENAVQQYPRVDDAVSYGYQEAGHHFYVIHFPSANGGLGATWALDINEGKMAQRGFWDTSIGQYKAALGRFHMFAFGKHLVGSYLDGSVYEQNLNFATDAGNPIRWLRRFPHVYKQNVRLFYRQFIVDMQVGDAPATGQGSDPQIVLRWSNDGGATWSNEVTQGTGALGQYRKRVTFSGLEATRDRVFEMFGTDPIQNLCLTNAQLFVEVGRS